MQFKTQKVANRRLHPRPVILDDVEEPAAAGRWTPGPVATATTASGSRHEAPPGQQVDHREATETSLPSPRLKHGSPSTWLAAAAQN